ncbi:hypothetical protein BGW38_010586 [Lunasporangiospora selenospora]|uniref:Transmembrane protein 198 n=1 Tax=Lunasporangiospora selenospora TaxID=979761 RepID=A0A9P6FWI3_9FUNG|nr:hypothetical protein BGW38_010586 [Lunasporangiospora selenospora]
MYRGFMRLEVNEDEDDTNASMRSLTQERPSIIAIPDEDEEEDTSSNESGTHRSEVTGGSPSMDRSGTENQITPPVTSLGSGSTVPGTGAETGSQRSNEAPIGIQVPQSPTRQGLTSWYTVQSIPWQIPRTSLMTTARTPGHPPSDSFPINTLTSSVSTGSGSSLAVAPSPSSRRNQMEVEMRLGTGGSVPLLEYYRTIEFTYFSTVEPSQSLGLSNTQRLLKTAPFNILIVISFLFNILAQSMAAPIDRVSKAPSDVVDTAREGPYNISVQAGIAGAILIVAGLLLCFFGFRFFRITMFLIGFYFFGNLTYIGMANGGVTSKTLLLVVSIIVGIIGGLLLVCCSRLGVAVLGALALYSLGLWILGWKSGGLITSSVGRGIFLAVLAIVGFILGLCREKETVIVGSAIVGAYSVVVGIDMYAQTGFVQLADSFINSKNSIDDRVSGDLTWKEYALLATFIVLALLGMVVQFRAWGRRAFRPAHGHGPHSNVVYTEKPSRFGGFFRRRRRV